MQNDHLSLPERVAVLETRMDDLLEIKEKLDELLHLKSKGIGALWFVSLIVGSGLLGLVTTIMAWLNKPHL